MSCQIINYYKNIENSTYLELGVYDNRNFRAIKSLKKVSVDTLVTSNATFTGTTDEYFEQLNPNISYDFIFIDACHDYAFVLKDYNNSIKHCNKWILIHDMFPPTDEFSLPHRCGDGFKLLYYFYKETNYEVYTMNENYGLTLIRMPAGPATPQKIYSDITYLDFVNFIANIKLYNAEEIIDILNR